MLVLEDGTEILPDPSYAAHLITFTFPHIGNVGADACSAEDAGEPDDELGVGTGYNLVYCYQHWMELAVALYLRQQAILPRDIVKLLADDRTTLRPM